MAPEVISSMPYSFSADIWGLGVIFYELITLKLEINHYVKILKSEKEHFNLMKEEFIKVDERYEDIFPIIHGMLNVDPKERISLEDSLDQLKKISTKENGEIDDWISKYCKKK